MMRLDLRLNAIVDPEQAGGHSLPDLARQCASGGATLLPIPDKPSVNPALIAVSVTRAMIDVARAIKQALAPFGVPFVVNDRVDVAIAAGADGVHLGQEDMTVKDARRLLGSEAIVGLSVKSVDEAEAAPVDLIDY